VEIEVRGLKCKRSVKKGFLFSEKPKGKFAHRNLPSKREDRCGIGFFCYVE
jgi:hypothetical protein